MACVCRVGESLWRVPPHEDEKHTYLLTTPAGPVMSLSAMGSSIVVLSSREAISDLLEKRGATYSDRPLAIMAGEL